jgi:hypothetical protein
MRSATQRDPADDVALRCRPNDHKKTPGLPEIAPDVLSIIRAGRDTALLDVYGIRMVDRYLRGRR